MCKISQSPTRTNRQKMTSPDESRRRLLEAKKRWRDKNKEKQAALSKAWALKNRERVNAVARARYAANPELHRARIKRKRDRNREAFNAWSREWKKNSPTYKAKRVAYEAKRKASITSCVDAVNRFIEHIRSKKRVRCYYCADVVSGSSVHFDHIMPLAKGGSHSPENLCASCPSCNLKKGTKAIGSEWNPGPQAMLCL